MLKTQNADEMKSNKTWHAANKMPKTHPWKSVSNGIWSTWKIVIVDLYPKN
ncbi:hypothetical protein SAMN05421636_104408 [Pricia antarctica]|uniref:Uncharacterized protein n=1 Tax=Pricia antarctica TaxID=641691 RepID=A0A1G7C467_9FLAO|nr:hypothetical protein SAMN05421636_104408 [Pricia antarctica]